MAKYGKNFRTYSGSDIVAVVMPMDQDVPPVVLGELMAISYSVNRQKYPVRVLGSAPILAYTKGPRTVAGTMVFSVFDEHALRELMDLNSIDFSSVGIGPQLRGMGLSGSADVGSVAEGEALTGGLAKSTDQQHKIHTVDDIPPFDIVVTFANEYGSTSTLKIIGAEFVDDGAVMSIQDLITQNTISYVARDIVLLTRTTHDQVVEVAPAAAATFKK